MEHINVINLDLNTLVEVKNETDLINLIAGVLKQSNYQVKMHDGHGSIGFNAVHNSQKKRSLEMNLHYNTEGLLTYSLVQNGVSMEFPAQELVMEFPKIIMAKDILATSMAYIRGFNRVADEIITGDSLIELAAESSPSIALPAETQGLYAVVWKSYTKSVSRNVYNIFKSRADSFLGFEIADVANYLKAAPAEDKKTDLVDVIVGNNDKKPNAIENEVIHSQGEILTLLKDKLSPEQIKKATGYILRLFAHNVPNQGFRMDISEDGYLDLKLIHVIPNSSAEPSNSLEIRFRAAGEIPMHIETIGGFFSDSAIKLLGLTEFIISGESSSHEKPFDQEAVELVTVHYVFARIVSLLQNQIIRTVPMAQFISEPKCFTVKVQDNIFRMELTEDLKLVIKVNNEATEACLPIPLKVNHSSDAALIEITRSLFEIVIQRLDVQQSGMIRRSTYGTPNAESRHGSNQEGFFQNRDTTLNNLPHRHVPVGNPYITLDEVHYGFHTAMAMVGSTPRVPSLLSRVIAVSILNGALLRLVASGIPSPNIEKIHKISLMITSGLEDAALARLGSPQDYYIFLANIGSQYSLG